MKNNFKRVFQRIAKWVVANKFFLLYLLSIAVLVVLTVIDINQYLKLGLVILFCFLQYLGIMVFIECEREEHKIPKYSKRLTRKTEDGNVVLNEGDLQQAIIYLYAVEEYIEKEG